jgi:Na+/phosphate symporter
MATIQNNGKSFNISDEMQAKYPELIKLILNTESMDDDERQYWFDIMPSMTDSQIDRLFNILETERKKLDDLEIKYQKEIKSLNEKHLIEWQEFQVKQSKQKMAKAKAEEKSEEQQDPDDVLKMLNDL